MNSSLPETPRLLVWLIDDEADDDMARVDTLRRAGFEVTVMNHVTDAVAAMASAKEAPDAILLDVMMPPEGYTTLQESQGGRFTGAILLRDIRVRFPDVPVVIVSAHNEDDVRDRLPGIAAFVEKPATTKRLITVIREALRLS